MGRLRDALERHRKSFDLPGRDVRWTLAAVHWMQAVWMIVAGALLVLAPRERFTPAYEFILAVPAGQYLAGGTYIAVGLSLVYAMIVGHQSGMSRGLFVGGVLGMLFGVVLLFGTAAGGKGVVFWLFAIYTGLHMLLQSALVSTRRAA